MSRRRLLAVALALAVVLGIWVAGIVRPDGRKVLRLPAGGHAGFTVSEPMIVRADEGAIVRGPIQITSDHVRLEGVVVEGAETAVSVRDAEDVVLDGVVVRGATFGVDANDAAVTIRNCTITGVPTVTGQGIEVRNSLGRPRSVVEGCRVEGGREGIVSHVSRVEVRRNVVTSTAMRGIAITEMSEGLVEGNVIRGVTGTGIYCGDMSHCEIRHNTVTGVTPDPAGIRQRDGQAAVAWYYSTVRLRGNDFDVARADPVDVYHGSVEVERFPLSHWPAGWRGAVPGLAVVAVALTVAFVARGASNPVARRARRLGFVGTGDASRVRLGRDFLLTVGLVQVLHVGEHAVQVFQVNVAQSETRQGLAGRHFDTEWLHLGFNAILLVGLLAGMWFARQGLAARFTGALAWLLAATAIQSWHMAEHVARVLQYLASGINPAPGLIGDDLGLVWFHFGINVAVIAAMVAGGLAALRGRAVPSKDRRDTDLPAGALVGPKLGQGPVLTRPGTHHSVLAGEMRTGEAGGGATR